MPPMTRYPPRLLSSWALEAAGAGVEVVGGLDVDAAEPASREAWWGDEACGDVAEGRGAPWASSACPFSGAGVEVASVEGAVEGVAVDGVGSLFGVAGAAALGLSEVVSLPDSVAPEGVVCSGASSLADEAWAGTVIFQPGWIRSGSLRR